MNKQHGKALAILSLVAASGVPVLILMIRGEIFTFREDYYGLKAITFALTWALALLFAGAILGGLAWSVDHRSSLAKTAFIVNGVLLIGLLWILFTF